MKKQYGFVIRFQDEEFTGGKSTIKEHNRLLAKEGKVWVGKFGRHIGQINMNLCFDQDTEVYLILAKSGKRQGTGIYIARVVEGQNTRPQKTLIPSYYQKRTDVRSWLLIKEPLKELSLKEISRWVIRSSGMPLIESLASSMAGFFVAVKKGSNLVNLSYTQPVRRQTSDLRPANLTKDLDALTFDDFVAEMKKEKDNY